MFAAVQDNLGSADRSGDSKYKGWLTAARYDFPIPLSSKGASGIDRFEIFGHIIAESFLPGDYYDSSKPAYFIRWGSKFQVLIANAKERTPPAENPYPRKDWKFRTKPVMERTLQQSECKVFYRYGQIKERGTIYLTSSPTPQCRLECLLICGKCREMRRSEAEGRFGEAEPEGCASIRAFSWEACGASF